MGLKKIIYKVLNKFIQEKEHFINAEAIIRDEEWEKLKKLVGNDFTWFVITPANYEYCKNVFNLNIDKNEFVDILKFRINYLKENNETINLAIHLGKVKKFLDKISQEKKFNEAIQFLNSIGIIPEAFITLDDVFNLDSIKIAQKYGLKNLLNLNLNIINPLSKFINLIGLKTSFIHEIYKNLKLKYFKNIFYLIVAELREVREKTIHVEAIVSNELWDNLRKKAIGRNFTWYIITPANYEYCKTYFNLKMEKNQFSNILKERIEYLKEKGENIQLHIHFTKIKEFLDTNIQEDKFKEAMDFMHSCNIIPRKFAAGWWIYNYYTIKLAKKYGFNEIFDYTINPFLKERTINGMKIKFVHKYWHDFDFF